MPGTCQSPRWSPKGLQAGGVRWRLRLSRHPATTAWNFKDAEPTAQQAAWCINSHCQQPVGEGLGLTAPAESALGTGVGGGLGQQGRKCWLTGRETAEAEAEW